MMYKNVLSLLGMALVLLSCSSDKDENIAEDVALNAILGTWDATALVIDNDTASDDAKTISQALAVLTEKECYVLTLQFNQDLTATATDSSANLTFTLDQQTSTFDVLCPEESETESSTYTYDGKVITTVGTNGEILMIDVSIDGNVMSVDASDLELPNFNDEGQLIFLRR